MSEVDRIDQIARLSPKRLALLCLELQGQVDALRGAQSEPLAIIGLGCRFPGADSPAAFWELLRAGRDAVREVPRERWDVDALFDPTPDTPGKTYTRQGAFLDQVDGFDAPFFGISPREAVGMDPQHRLLLEVSFEALERAGWPPERLAGSRTGVFVGIGIDDYAKRMVRALPLERIDAYTGTGNAFCFAAGRLSYLLGLQGPSLALDTACSTSLVAVHLACQSLRSGECSLALAGGVNLMLSPEPTLFLSRARALAPDGRCKTFDAAADGYGRGEGCGVVVLKRLSDALADRDEVLAVIRGSAVNHDGASSGLTVPNGLAQQAVIRAALANAGLQPGDVSYVEAHGTGTLVGDPIEMRALAAVFGPGRSPQHPLLVASVKTNIGHLEVAAGIASLIKVVLALRQREIPPHLHLRQVNPYIDLDAVPARVPDVVTPWPDGGRERVAGISSFGLSGTNAHVLVEQAAARVTPVEPARPAGFADLGLLTLSARSAAALIARAQAHRRFIAADPGVDLRDVVFTAAVRRSHHAHRLVVPAGSRDDLLRGLDGFLEGVLPPGVFAGVCPAEAPQPAFVFFGGHDWDHARLGVLAERVHGWCRILAGQPALPGALLGDVPRAAREHAPTVLLTLHLALAAFWRACGVRPTAVTGHGVGALAAACVAGERDLVDALRVVAGRLDGHGRSGDAAAAEALARALGSPRSPQAQPALFADASDLRGLRELGCGVLLALGPDAALAPAVSKGFTEAGGVALPSLQGGPNGESTPQRALGRLYVLGCSPDWSALFPSGRLVDLPTYPWQRERLWLDLPAHGRRESADAVARAGRHSHPLLGESVRLAASGDLLFQVALDPRRLPFLADHRILGRLVLPATACLEMALAAAAETLGPGPCAVEDVEIREALLLDDRAAVTAQLTVQAADAHAANFQLWAAGAAAAQAPTLHATGTVRPAPPRPGQPAVALDEVRARCAPAPPVGEYYQSLRARGLDFGPTFQGLQKVWRRDGEALGRVGLVDALTSEAASCHFHPALLDACLHLFGAALSGDSQGRADAYVPVRIRSLRVHTRPVAPFWALATLDLGGHRREGFSGDLRVLDDVGELLAELEGVVFRRVEAGVWGGDGEAVSEWLNEVVWRNEELVPSSGAGVGGRWLVLSDEGGVGEALSRRLRESGAECEVLRAGEVEGSGGDASEELSRSLRSRLGDGGSWRGVVHLWGLDESGNGAAPEWRGAGSALGVMQALSGLGLWGVAELCLVTRGSQSLFGEAPRVEQAVTWGLGGVLSSEHAEARCRRVDLDPQWGGVREDAEFVWRELNAGGVVEEQVASRTGRYVARLVRAGAEGELESGWRLEVPRRGVLELSPGAWQRREPGAGEVELRVVATGLNFKDVMNALGVYPGEAGALGGECSGRVVRVGSGVEGVSVGDEVLAVSTGSFASHVTVTRDRVVKKPECLSHVEAASIPVAFVTAHYGLEVVGCLKAGERVLIHAGSGGVGLAAVQLAQRLGAEVLATAGSERKREYLRSLGVKCVMSSRSLEFVEGVREWTGGRGVEVVLNSLSGEFIEASLGVVARGGRFVEIGKTGILSVEEARRLRADVAYQAIALDEVSVEPGRVGALLVELVGRFERGELSVLPRRVYGLGDVSGAFRHMAQAKHIGKVVVLQRERERPVVESGEGVAYLVTGGLGALGLRAAEWLVERGARYVVLLGRSEPSESARAVLKRLEGRGAQMVVRRADVGNAAELARVLGEVRGAGRRVRGVVHAAGVLDDGVLEQQSWGRCVEVMKGKAHGAWNLHEQLSGERPDFFVMYSSMASVLGAPGQGNYAAANAYLDALAHLRRSQGQRAVSINWGPWSQGGMGTGVTPGRWGRQGLRLLEPEAGLRALEEVLAGGFAQVGVMPVKWEELLGRTGREGVPSLLRELAAGEGTRGEAAAEEATLVKRLRHSAAGQRRGLLLEHVREQVRQLLEFKAAEALPEDQGLVDLGLDSLMAVELRNRLYHSLGRTLPSTLAFDHPTLAALTDYLLDLLALKAPPAADDVPEPDAELASMLDRLENLSEEQALELLSEKTRRAGS